MKTYLSSSLRWLSAARRYATAHKIISSIVAIVLVGGGWYIARGSSAAPIHYILGEAATSTIIASVSASGQVSASDQVDVKAKVSADVVRVDVAAGDRVAAGQALVSLDATDALQSYKDAENSLTQAELQYQKDSAQAPIDYQKDQDSLTTAKEDLANAYNDSFNTLTDTYLDFPAVMTSAQSALFGYDFDSHKSQWNMDILMNLVSDRDTGTAAGFELSSKSDYAAARAAYDQAVAAYKLTSRTSSTDTQEALLGQSIDMATAVTQALQSELNFYGAVSDLAQTYDLRLPASFTTVQSGIRSELSTANGDLSSLLSQKKTITSDKQAVTSATQAITLDQVGNTAGNNPINLQIEKNNLDKQTADLAQQQADLADYTVRAPFAGTVSSVAVQKGDTASGAVATIVTDTQLAQLSLNEVDAAKIKLGEKATLTFDAINGLTLTGAVAEIDSVGTVSQGVVSYTVKISFDAQDPRVKPGMTVNADIETAVHQDALAVPQSAVKAQGAQSYVLVFDPPLSDTGASSQGVESAQAPVQVPVTLGISDDTQTEILSGLTAGEQIVVRTTTGSAATSATAATRSAAGAGAAGARGGFGGGGIRIGG